MSIYKFKIYFEDDENVYREIEIKATQTFEDLHKAIQKAINFDDIHPASFYMSNDTWRKGKEIKLLRNKQQEEAKKNGWMHEAKIAPYMEDPHQKMVYEYDPNGGNWVIFVELLKILPDAPVTYPRINKSVGTSPIQYKVTTPVEVTEDEEEGENALEEEDNYVKNLSEHEHYEENEEAEVENEIKVHAKSTNNSDEEEGTTEEESSEEEGEGFEGESGFEEEDI